MMLSTATLTSAELQATSFAYVECDLSEGQTLAEWRRERAAARRATQRRRSCFSFALGKPMWSSS
jgi:hypothetical protein